MQESDVYGILTNIFKDVFASDEISINADTSSGDIDGWDSFKQIEIILAVQQHYKIKLSSREVDGLKNVGDLVKIIIAKTR